MSTESTTEQDERRMTPEQIKNFLQKKLEFYNEQIPVLGKELEYQTLITQVEEQRLKQIMYVAQQGQILAPEAEAPENNTADSIAPEFDQKTGQPKRKLKAD